ncbi:MAG: ATP-binding protein [Candidatus Njordarchaeia archaeon]
MDSEEILGLISGKATTTSFAFNIRDVKKVQRNQYILAIDVNDNRKILAHIKSIVVSGSTSVADCEVLGEVIDGKLIPPKRPITIGSKVIKPPSELLAELLARVPKETRLLVGRVFTQMDLVPVYFNPADFARHMVVVATTGGGKSYSMSVFIEELLKLMERGKKDFAIVIFDVHNEYGGLALPNNDQIQIEKLKKYGLEPRGFEEDLMVFDWNVNPIMLKDDFDPERLLFLYNVKELRFALILKELIGERETMPLNDLLVKLEVSDLHAQTKQALVTRIRALRESGLFSRDAPNFSDLIEPGKATIIRLANAPLGDYGVRFIVADVLRGLFNEAKSRRLDFNVLIVIDEAHLFAPKKGKIDAVRDVIERVSREGRKYGVWLVLATQSPRDLSDTVIINCSSMLALKMLKKDISEFAKVFDIPKEIAEILVDLPPGRGYLKAPSLTLPILLEVRPRMSREVKGSIEQIREIEDKVAEIAKRTKEHLSKKFKEKVEKTVEPMGEEKEEKEGEKEEEKTGKVEVKEEKRKVAEIERKIGKEEKEKKLEEMEKKVKETKMKKVVKVKLEKEKPVVIVIDGSIIEELVDNIISLGYGPRELIKHLLEEGRVSLSRAFTMVDERILEALLMLGVIEKRANFIMLSLDKYLRRILGYGVTKEQFMAYKKYLKEKLGY